jgi:hypothetical protein
MYYTWGMLDTENIAQMISYEVPFQVLLHQEVSGIYILPRLFGLNSVVKSREGSHGSEKCFEKRDETLLR